MDESHRHEVEKVKKKCNVTCHVMDLSSILDPKRETRDGLLLFDNTTKSMIWMMRGVTWYDTRNCVLVFW